MDAKTSQVAKDLKQLRKKAGIPLRLMAKTLEFMTAGSYQHYEDRYKKDSLPYELATRVSKVCSAPGSLDTSLSHAAGLIEIAACHA